MTIPIGKLRHRMTIERETLTGDGGGGAVAVWEDVGEVWGAIEAVSGGERLEADRTAGHVSYVITIRHRSGVEPAMRFRRDEELYRIPALTDRTGRRRFLHCLCERRDL
jgi:SPP1 family predicted phage head-tail adaptor